jgi:RHS repeat-associated protein
MNIGDLSVGNHTVTAFAYDALGVGAVQLTNPRSITVTGETVYSVSLGYAPNSHVTSANDLANGNWSYSYDNFNRLATASKTAQGCAFVYDRFGNRWQQNNTGAGNCYTPAYSFDAHNRIAPNNGVSYDAAGNVSSWNNGATTYNYTYDAENRLIGVSAGGLTVSFGGASPERSRRDAQGRRIRRVVNGDIRDSLYDLAGHAFMEFSGGGSAPWPAGTWVRGEVYAGARHLATYVQGTTYFHHADWLGTERVRTGVTGSVVESFTSLPFGDGLSGQGVSPLHFTGQEHDTETNLDHFWFRQYASTQGRWLTPDPAGLSAVDPTNPQSWNRYAYVANNPTNLIDPLGLRAPIDVINTLLNTGNPGTSAGSVWDAVLSGIWIPPMTTNVFTNYGTPGGTSKFYPGYWLGFGGWSYSSQTYSFQTTPASPDPTPPPPPRNDVPLTPNAQRIFAQVGRTAPQVVHPCTIAGFYGTSVAAVAFASQTAAGAAVFPELSEGVFGFLVRTVPPAMPYVRRAERLFGRAIAAGTAAIKAGCDAFGN